jgi:hypothetical protein
MSEGNKTKIQNGKGDSPRNISKKYFENFDAINWGKDKKEKTKNVRRNK